MQDLILDHHTAIVIPPGTALKPAGDVPLRIRCEDYEGPMPLARLSVLPWFGRPPLAVVVSTEGSAGEQMAIDWGDGETLEPIDLAESVSHTYAGPGQYIVTIRVGIGNQWNEDAWPVYCFDEASPEPPVGFINSFIDKATALATKYRNKYFLIDAVYRRGDEEWPVKISPGKPETPGLDFDQESAFLDATEFIIPLEQPADCLQIVQNGLLIFKPKSGDLIRYRLGALEMVKKVSERGNGPCWNVIFGNREMQVHVEQYRE